MRGVYLSRQAERDLRRLGSAETLARIREALTALVAGESALGVKSLVGAAPWLRLRVGDYRIVLRPVRTDEEMGAKVAWLVARVVHRRDLERAVSTLI